MKNRICNLFNIKFPIVQAGMVWCSGWKLASAVSKAGGLGLLGSGSMYPEVLKQHIRKCKDALGDIPFGVNVPLIYPNIEEHMKIIVEEGVKIVFTSAGNPKAWTSLLKRHEIKVAHVVSSVKFAIKACEAGVDAIVGEGFEAGGHNGREETTTFCLIPLLREAVDVPLVAAGGIANGRGMLGAMALGADGVQIGSRFVASDESSAHPDFKNKIVGLPEGGTILSLKKITPVRLIKNKFWESVDEAEQKGASIEELRMLLGKGRSKKGIFEGDLDEGELEIGQISAAIKDIKPAGEIVNEIWQEYINSRTEFCFRD